MKDASPSSTIAHAMPSMVAPSIRGFLDLIDDDNDATKSVVLRYRDAVRLEPGESQDRELKDLLVSTSIREGIRTFSFLTYKGVMLDIMDETSMMRTRTLKSIDGCVTTAHCRRRGYDSVVFESGGNTGTALTVYLNNAGIETFLFLPADNVPLLDRATFSSGACHVIAVEDARDVKPGAHEFAARRGIPRIPELAWRLQASAFIGAFVLEHLVSGEPYDFLAQSISAAFGPIGIYNVLETYRDEIAPLPRFLGVQQETNSPMVNLWRSGGTEAAPDVSSTAGLIAKVMYDSAPGTYGTFDLLRHVLEQTRGSLTTISGDEFRGRLASIIDGRTVLEHLADCGLTPTTRDGEVVEKAGLMSLVGTLQQIDEGRIPGGSRVLILVTGSTARPDGMVTAAKVVDGELVESG